MSKIIVNEGDRVRVKGTRKFAMCPQEWTGRVVTKRVWRLAPSGPHVEITVKSDDPGYRGTHTFFGDLRTGGQFREWQIVGVLA